MTRHDPYTAPGAIYIASDFAPAAPVPPGTRLGNIREMAEAMEPFHTALVKLTKDPVKLKAAAHDLAAALDESDAEIIADIEARRARGEFAGGLGV